MRFLFSLLFFCATTSCFAGEKIEKVFNPVEVRSEILLAKSSPKEMDGLEWNRWTSKNFIVLSTNNNYANYLNAHLELVKSWCIGRWGLFDVDFTVPCKFICVDDPVLFEKMFKLKKTRVEVRRDANGQIKETVIFLIANDKPSHCVPEPVTEVCLAEFAQQYETVLAWWTYRGISILNGSLDQIRKEVADLSPVIKSNAELFFAKGLFETTKKDYDEFSDDDKKLFDECSMCLCLLIRKELGQNALHSILKNNSEPSIKRIGYKSFDDFDKTFKRYMMDLVKDVQSGKTPDSYLQIFEPGGN